jgi:hypothetical protein
MIGAGFVRGAVVGGVGAAVVLFASSALAGTGVGAVFNLGVSNAVNQTTSLTGASAGAQLAVTNGATSGGARALSLTGGSKTTQTLQATNPNNGSAAAFVSSGGKPPFTVNSTGKVVKLDADLLDGLDSSAFLGVGAKAADSDRLDGLDSSQFVQGPGISISHAEAIPPGGGGSYIGPGGGQIEVDYDCPSVLTHTGTVTLSTVTGGGPTNVFYDTGQANPTYVQMPEDSAISVPMAAAGDSVTFQIQGALGDGYGIATIFVDTVNRTTDCHFQVQGLFTVGQ